MNSGLGLSRGLRFAAHICALSREIGRTGVQTQRGEKGRAELLTPNCKASEKLEHTKGGGWSFDIRARKRVRILATVTTNNRTLLRYPFAVVTRAPRNGERLLLEPRERGMESGGSEGKNSTLRERF